MSFALQAKNNFLGIISDMAKHPEDFLKHPDSDFSRNPLNPDSYFAPDGKTTNMANVIPLSKV